MCIWIYIHTCILHTYIVLYTYEHVPCCLAIHNFLGTANHGQTGRMSNKRLHIRIRLYKYLYIKSSSHVNCDWNCANNYLLIPKMQPSIVLVADAAYEQYLITQNCHINNIILRNHWKYIYWKVNTNKNVIMQTCARDSKRKDARESETFKHWKLIWYL